MRVFVENEAGKNEKHRFDEKSYELLETHTLAADYPFAYGFIVGTTSGDGDNMDCFVVTEHALRTGDFVECELIGILEFLEGEEMDFKALVRPSSEAVDAGEKEVQAVREFIAKIFSVFPDLKIGFGRFLGMEESLALIEASRRLDERP